MLQGWTCSLSQTLQFSATQCSNNSSDTSQYFSYTAVTIGVSHLNANCWSTSLRQQGSPREKSKDGWGWLTSTYVSELASDTTIACNTESTTTRETSGQLETHMTCDGLASTKIHVCPDTWRHASGLRCVTLMFHRAGKCLQGQRRVARREIRNCARCALRLLSWFVGLLLGR